VAYVELEWVQGGKRQSLYGVDVDSSIVGASIRALIAAVNRIVLSQGDDVNWPEPRMAKGPPVRGTTSSNALRS
jgi:hypothetical protein